MITSKRERESRFEMVIQHGEPMEQPIGWRFQPKNPMKRPKSIVDVGCGIGGSSRYLARKYEAQCQGITLRPVQAQMAEGLATSQGLASKVCLFFENEQGKDIKAEDWSEYVAPFWPAVIRSALTWNGFISLLMENHKRGVGDAIDDPRI
ncbi:hypothetical protein CsSME_00042359 [Camellia sinensis var. sinensis]